MLTDFVVAQGNWDQVLAPHPLDTVERELLFKSEKTIFRRFEVLGFRDGSLRFVAEAFPGKEQIARMFFQKCYFSEHLSFHQFGVFYARSSVERSRMLTRLTTDFSFPEKALALVRDLAKLETFNEIDQDSLKQALSTVRVWQKLAGIINPPSFVFNIPDTSREVIQVAKGFEEWLEKHKERLAMIKKLDLTYMQLEYLPGAVFKYTPLESLNIEHNQLSVFPSSITALRTLHTLIIRNNRFTALPEEIRALHNLEVLICNGNLLGSVPPWLPTCTKLARLYLNDNKLTVMPECILELPKLKTFCFLDNFLDYNAPVFKKLHRRGITFQAGTPIAS